MRKQIKKLTVLLVFVVVLVVASSSLAFANSSGNYYAYITKTTPGYWLTYFDVSWQGANVSFDFGDGYSSYLYTGGTLASASQTINHHYQTGSYMAYLNSFDANWDRLAYDSVYFSNP